MEISVDCAVIINPIICLDSKSLSRCKDYRKAQKPGGLEKRWAQCKFRKERQRNGLCEQWHIFQYLGEQSKQIRFQRTKDRHFLSKTKRQITHLPFVNF